MERIPVFVGLDYHKDGVQVYVMDPEGKVLGNRSCGNGATANRPAVPPRVSALECAGRM